MNCLGRLYVDDKSGGKIREKLRHEKLRLDFFLHNENDRKWIDWSVSDGSTEATEFK